MVMTNGTPLRERGAFERRYSNIPLPVLLEPESLSSKVFRDTVYTIFDGKKSKYSKLL
jgi:hypothetical protein